MNPQSSWAEMNRLEANGYGREENGRREEADLPLTVWPLIALQSSDLFGVYKL